jgi:8-amino-7-oxononanoate synthase
LICGSLGPVRELEAQLAAFKGTEAALTFSTGYSAALGTLQALMGKGDVVILDKLVHACVVDAARLSGARLRVFAHNNLEDLESKLRWASSLREGSKDAGHTLIVTESVFSMDGDTAPLQEIVRLKERYGAWLMVDEAHATGLYGPHRRGLAESLGIADQIDLQMGTLGKAVGASGGYLCGSRTLVDYLVNRARSLVFSTAPVPAAVAAASAGVAVIQGDEGKQLNQVLWDRVAQFRSAFRVPGSVFRSAIIPVLLGDESMAVSASAELYDQGIFAPAIRYPTVPRGSARLRLTLSAAHSQEEVARLSEPLSSIVNRQSSPPHVPAGKA